MFFFLIPGVFAFAFDTILKLNAHRTMSMARPSWLVCSRLVHELCVGVTGSGVLKMAVPDTLELSPLATHHSLALFLLRGMWTTQLFTDTELMATPSTCAALLVS